MKQLVIMPGGFHPFHAGHAALYQSAVDAFPGADVFVAATNDTSTRPFPFPVKEKLAQLAGVPKGRFTQVKSPFRAEEIVHKYDPNNTQLIFVRSEKDAGSQPRPGGTKKDGTPSYLQPYDDASDQPLSQRAYMAYLPTVEFGPGMTSATEIRSAWPRLNEKRKTALVMSLYPKTQTNPKLAATVVKLLDTAMGLVDESALDNLPRPNKRNQFKSLHKQRKQRGLDEQGMAETINSAILNPRFKHKQVIGDYTYTATAEDFEGAPLLWIKAYDGDREIGHILFEIIVRSPGGRRKSSADYLESGGTEVDPAYRNKGVASTMYAYAKMLGNDVQPSYNQTSQGQAMWAAWEKAGDAKHLVGTSMESSESEDLHEGPFVQRIMHPGKVSIYVRSGKVPKLVATDIPYEILDRYIAKVIAKYPQFKPSDFSFESSDKVSENQGWAATLENTAPNPRVDLTPNYPNYATLVGEFIGIKKNRALFRVIAAELKPGQGETEKIFRAMSTNTPIGIEIGKVKNRAVLEALKPDAFAALQQAKQNIEQNRQQEVDQWEQDFRANSAKLAGQQPKQRFNPPAVPVAQSGEKHSVLKNRIAQLDQAIKKQQQLDALSQKLEYKGLLTPAMQQDFDTRLLVRGAAADNYQALNLKLDRAIEIATNRLRTNKLAFKENADYIDEANKQ
jgi:GNAT superfamily N-acetyltransferase